MLSLEDSSDCMTLLYEHSFGLEDAYLNMLAMKNIFYAYAGIWLLPVQEDWKKVNKYKYNPLNEHSRLEHNVS